MCNGDYNSLTETATISNQTQPRTFGSFTDKYPHLFSDLIRLWIEALRGEVGYVTKRGKVRFYTDSLDDNGLTRTTYTLRRRTRQRKFRGFSAYGVLADIAVRLGYIRFEDSGLAWSGNAYPGEDDYSEDSSLTPALRQIIGLPQNANKSLDRRYIRVEFAGAPRDVDDLEAHMSWSALADLIENTYLGGFRDAARLARYGDPQPVNPDPRIDSGDANSVDIVERLRDALSPEEYGLILPAVK